MLKKSIIEKRCPWCGNIIKNEITFEVNLNRFSAKCKKCSQWYVQKNTWRIFTSLILFSYLIYIYENSFNLLWEYILIIPIAIIDIIITRKTSVIKYQNGAWYKPLPPEFKKVNVKIRWFSKEKGGLYLTNIRI